MFYRTIRANIRHLPESPASINEHKNLAEKEKKTKEKAKEYCDKRNHTKKSEIKIGDQVLVRQQKKINLISRYSTNPYTVTEIKKGSRITAQNQKHNITRNKSFFKGAANVKDNESEDSESEDEFNEQNNEQNDQEEQHQF